jgi:dihydroflavonol-4-reductase
MLAFVTGATGFIGGNLTRALLADGHQVRILVRPGSDQRNIAGLPVELAPGNLADRRLLTEQIMGCDVIFHVAAHYSLWAKDRAEIYRTNIEGTENLLAAARLARTKRFIHTSSVAAIGVPAPNTLGVEETQTTLEELVSDYKKSKFLAERAVQRAARAGLDVVIVNLQPRSGHTTISLLPRARSFSGFCKIGCPPMSIPVST